MAFPEVERCSPGAGQFTTTHWSVVLAAASEPSPAAAQDNALLGNSMFGNSSIGLDVGSFSPADLGPTLNDPADGDDGANHSQNFPAGTSVKIAGRNLKMEYRVDSAAANSACPMP